MIRYIVLDFNRDDDSLVAVTTVDLGQEVTALIKVTLKNGKEVPGELQPDMRFVCMANSDIDATNPDTDFEVEV